MNKAIHKMVATVVREHADQEIGQVDSNVWAAMVRGDMLDVVNDAGFELDGDVEEELRGVVGAIVIRTKDRGRVVQLFNDDDELSAAWDETAAQFM